MRPYITFGSDDKKTWRELGVYQAASPEQARALARENNGGYEHYSATTQRGWAPATPQDKVTTTWAEIDHGQLTVDDVLSEAKEALRSAKGGEVVGDGT